MAGVGVTVGGVVAVGSGPVDRAPKLIVSAESVLIAALTAIELVDR